ncbi:uncharacterized protein N7515_005427 [Penicillium bovifimosum]|uniref:DUF7514 domain-containing protein n=1 Tax=Penicillium bovifimosum TaxID=126998 RepID=A0A9W9GT35_9EURO|nr:uncharacterized protein N7515_005427 [Penicillium bovifimosum]KAJ5129388.1 hypothetical protein N7515_005427 [Penicillium bovifimosum]
MHMDYEGEYADNTYQPGKMNPDPNEYGFSSTPAHPSYHEREYLNMPQPQPPRTDPPFLDPYNYPSRQRSPNPSTGHINDAVNSAVQNSGPNAYLSPEILSQITATVIQQLKTTGLDNLQGSGTPPPRSQSQQPPWQPDASLRPHAGSPPTVPPPRSSSIPPPSSASDNIYTRDFPDAHQGYASDSPLSREPALDPSEDPAAVDGYLSSGNNDHGQRGQYKPERPKGPERDATVVGMSTLERYWGKLFEDGKPTKRLGQFLRGIAMHLIEDYPPGNTLVIPPYKMQKFYEDTHCPNDPYEWQDIFDDRTSSLSRLFREIDVEHHLIQKDLKSRPETPGLTPKGFEKWATLLILANPEREHERLQRAVRNMPINNPDDKKERFPKEIPRRLFPEIGDLEIREDLEDRLMLHCGVDMLEITEEERAQAAQSKRISTSTSAPSMERTHSYERGRPRPATPIPASAQKPRPRPVSMVTDDEDEDEPIPSVPIERERKPYSAHPGGGKVYDDSKPKPSRSHAGSFSNPRSSDASFHDMGSGSTSTPRMSDSYDRDRDRDPLYQRRSGSGASAEQRYRQSRSPSRGVNHGRHSDSDGLGRDGSRYAGLSAHDLHYVESPTSNLPSDADEKRRYRRGSRGSRGSEDDYYRGGRSSHGYAGDKYYR